MPRAKPSSTPVEMVLTDVEQLKVIGDPFRIQVIEAMAEDPARTWTAKELAARLGVKQTKLYRHLALLEQHGFLRIAETRIVSGIQEKRYQATAHGYRVDHALLTGSGSQAAVSETLDAIFRKARHELLEAMTAGDLAAQPEDPTDRRVGLWSTQARLSPAKAKRVMRLVQKLAEIDLDEDPDGAEYGLLVGFYPKATKD